MFQINIFFNNLESTSMIILLMHCEDAIIKVAQEYA